MTETSAAAPQRVIGVQIGSRVVTGPLAYVILAVLVLGLVALLGFMWRDSWAWGVSGVLWLGWFAYWSWAARSAAPAKSGESAESRRVHTRFLAAAFAFLFLPLPALTQRWLPRTDLIQVVGVGVEVLGLMLAVSARRHLGRNWSAQVRVVEDHALVQSGPYRLIRHPIYTAMIVMFLGTSIAGGAMHSLVGTAIIFGAYARKIRIEEATLRTAFGDAYVEYAKRTWALVPFLV